MQKVDVYHYLDSRNIWHEITEHEAVYSMGELSSVTLPYPEADAKNLFVRDDKKQKYYLITVKGDKRVDLKAFRQRNHTRPLSFAAPEELCLALFRRSAFCTMNRAEWNSFWTGLFWRHLV